MEAFVRWETTSLSTSQSALLHSTVVHIGDLPGRTLGETSGNTIVLDIDAAGWGWFVDQTPTNNSEFLRLGNQGEQYRMDLLTVVMHELGHVLGRDHDADGVMAESLAAGVRQTDMEHDQMALVDQVFSPPVDHHADAWFWALPDEHLVSRRLWFKRRR